MCDEASLCESYPHDPVVEDPRGLLVVQLGVADVLVDTVDAPLEGPACSAQPDGTHFLQLPRLQNKESNKPQHGVLRTSIFWYYS